ncbi:unnamed protein product [Thelazia callipaeda]|uniref:PH domain-containing protein n=1 Tax=Thelazia callipaeda TaxID=103827 RepID=A0A158RC62_THECL|nr:unnamed protein product [Thelazia callipaeda]
MSVTCSAIRQMAWLPAGNSGDDESTEEDTGGRANSSVDSLIEIDRDDDPDFRIRQRLEASRQGMLQLELLRNKHQKLMQEMRICLPRTIQNNPSRSSRGQSPEEQPRESPIANSHHEIKLNDSRCDSPGSCCVSHRSSVSMDSGCVLISSDLSSGNYSSQPMPPSTYRKFSIDDKRKRSERNQNVTEISTDKNPKLMAMAIKSITALRCVREEYRSQNCSEIKSCNTLDKNNVITVDSPSISQTTPLLIPRKFSVLSGKSKIAHTDHKGLKPGCIDASIRSQIHSWEKKSPTNLPSNQSSMLHTKPITLSLSSKIPTSPYMRLRNPQIQKPLSNSRIESNSTDNQSIFHASRIFVDGSPRLMQYPRKYMNTDRHDSDDENSSLLRAQPAIVLSRQQSYAQSNENSPRELRKNHCIKSYDSSSNVTLLGYHQKLSRCESSQSSETTMPDRPRRRKKEKDWKESEDL